VQVAGGQKFVATSSNPLFASGNLTLWAMTVAAAVVGNRDTMGTACALIDMAAQCRSAAARNGQQHFDVPPTNPLVVSLDEGSSRGADEIGNLQQRPGH
jgi:hypothetical protein